MISATSNASSVAAEDWSACSKWLTKVGLLPPDHRAHDSVRDLAIVLRDGVQLCRLVNLLQPGCLDMKEISQRPQMAQFLCLRNIRSFLLVCRNAFGLKEDDLFQPSELFELSDFSKVLTTLSKLSCTEKGGEGFVSASSPTAITFQPTRVSQLESLLDVERPNTYPLQPEYDYYYSTIESSSREEDIYQDLCYIHHSQTPVTLKEGRDYVKSELLETETNYVEALNMLKKKFVRPLSSILKEEERKIVFFGIKELSEIHFGFLSDLNRLLQNNSYATGHCKTIGDLFDHWKEKFILYGDYCANLTKAQGLIEELSAKEGVGAEIAKCEREANGGRFKLRGLLLVPMQRILKYHLLLKNLLAQTKIELHGLDEYKSIERACQIMANVAEFTNEVNRDSEILGIIRQIEGSIYDLRMPEGWQLSDYGRCQKEGDIKIRGHDDNRVKSRYVFVFDKVMLMCKSTRMMDKLLRGEAFSYKHSLCLQEYHVEELPPDSTKKLYGFNLVHHLQKNVYTLLAPSEQEKRRWIMAVENALSNISPPEARPTNHLFSMHTSAQGACCDVCHLFLKGLFYQGYKCIKCSITVHRACILRAPSCGTTPAPSLPPRPGTLLPQSTHNDVAKETTPTEANYMNLSLQAYPWYAGEMEREEATAALSAEENGAFLIRQRPGCGTDRSFALSLKWADGVKHMKILQSQELFYLSESRYFKSIVELIHWYSVNSLAESFSGLDACLETPFERPTL